MKEIVKISFAACALIFNTITAEIDFLNFRTTAHAMFKVHRSLLKHALENPKDKAYIMHSLRKGVPDCYVDCNVVLIARRYHECY